MEKKFPFYSTTPESPEITSEGFRLTPVVKNPEFTAAYFWYRNDSLIESFTDGTLLVPDSGTYTLCLLLKSGCFVCSQPYAVTIPLPDSGENPFVFPNPSDGVFLINGNTSLKGLNYNISDYKGKTIRQGVLNTIPYPLDIRYLSSGIYIFKTGNFRIRLVKI
jgi:hypothetical protein